MTRRTAPQTPVSAHEREIAYGVAMILLPPEARSAIESVVEGASPGDIASGKLVPFHTDFRHYPWSVKIGYYFGDDPEFRTLTVELLQREDVETIVRAFRVLAQWDEERSK